MCFKRKTSGTGLTLSRCRKLYIFMPKKCWVSPWCWGRLGLYLRGILGLYRGYIGVHSTTGMGTEVANSLRLAHLTDSRVYLCIPSPHLCLRRPIVTCCARQLKPLVGFRFVAPALSAGSSATKSSKFSIRRALEMRTRTHGNALRRLARRRQEV